MSATRPAGTRLAPAARHAVTDPRLEATPERADVLSTRTRPGTYLTLAHNPNIAVAYAMFWDETHRGGRVEHTIKELMRIAIAQLLGCQFCADQRSVMALDHGLEENDAQACCAPRVRSSRSADRRRPALRPRAGARLARR